MEERMSLYQYSVKDIKKNDVSLKDYEGTILFVSHDRYFIQKIAKTVLSIENGNADFYQINTKD